MMNEDTRTPSPPYGYSRECRYPLERQIQIVAEFHAHRIRPSRIAYRIGVDIALIEKLIAGEEHQEMFSALLSRYRRNRKTARLKDSLKLKGIAQSDLQRKIDSEFEEAQKF